MHGWLMVGQINPKRLVHGGINMIKYGVTKDNKYTHFKVEGHANFETKPDSFDIVCGMVSAVAQTILVGCAKNCKNVKMTVQKGLVEFYFPNDNKIACAMADAGIEGIDQIKQEYPQCFE